MSTHLPQLYTPTAAQAAGVPQPAQPDAARCARERLERRRRAFGGTLAGMWHEITYNASKHARGLIFCVTVAMIAWAALSVVILAKASGGQVVTPVPTFAPIVSVTPLDATETPTATPQPTAEPTATATNTPQSFSNLPACLTVSDIYEIEHTAQGEALGLHNSSALYFLMGQMLLDKDKTNCQPLYRWFARDNAQAKVNITQDTMNAWAKLAADYPGLYFGYCGQVGSEDDFNSVWLPQRLSKKLPLLRLDYAFSSGDGSSMELAFNCAPPLGK